MLVQPLPQCHGTMSINDHWLVNAHVRVIFHCVGLTAFHNECLAWFIGLVSYIRDVVSDTTSNYFDKMRNIAGIMA